MALVFLDEDQSNRNRVAINRMHFLPEILSDLDKVGGIEVVSVPESEYITGKVSQAYINLDTLEIWYEYEYRPLTPEEETRQRIVDLEMAMAALMGGAV